MLVFVAKVQEIIDNEPSKLMHAIARERGMDEKLFRLVVYEDITTLHTRQFLSKMIQEK